jgi:hypothetical protein
MKQKSLLCIAFMLLFLSINDSLCTHMRTKKAIDLRLDMRKLWEDHIVYTRNFIISAIANLEDINAVEHRLLRNQDDIGNAFKPFYGPKVGNKLTKLLREHILLAADVVADAIANNMSKFNKDYKKWKENAVDIANFLSKINRHWSKEDLKKMLYKHLALTTGEASSRLKKHWEADIRFYDENHIHMLMFSDVLTKGIVEQFPEKFEK